MRWNLQSKADIALFDMQASYHIERDKIRNVQLPQKFSREELVEAHRKAAEKGEHFTEDATLLVTEGFEVSFVEGKDTNFKVTTPLDVRLATYLLGPEKESENE